MIRIHQLPQQKIRRPIQYWQAYQCNKIVDTNNSIAILRSKWGGSAVYKAVR